MNKTAAFMLTLVMATVFLTGVVFSADPLEVAPDMYKLKFENDRVRVMEVTFQPGQEIAEHSHPDHFVNVLEGGKLRLTKAAGGSADVEMNVGDVVWIDAETHWAVNTGTTVVRLLVVEIKQPR